MDNGIVKKQFVLRALKHNKSLHGIKLCGLFIVFFVVESQDPEGLNMGNDE